MGLVKDDSAQTIIVEKEAIPMQAPLKTFRNFALALIAFPIQFVVERK
jgi:hypothetical protein